MMLSVIEKQCFMTLGDYQECSEILTWCNENCEGNFYVYISASDIIWHMEFTFNENESAMAFKLRWL